MQIAQVLAGYSLGGADLLRRAMGKKKPEEMAKQRVDLRRRRGRRAACASSRPTHIFDLMEKFAGYGFNKSHSAAYALLSYQTAYLKAHYPAAVHGGGAVGGHGPHRQGGHAHRGVHATWASTVLPPDVNASRYVFTVGGERTHPLRPRRGARRGRRARSRRSIARARGARRLREPRGPVPAPRPAEGQPARARGADALAAASMASAPTARR